MLTVYGICSPAMGSRPYISSIQPIGGQQYGPSDVLIFNIPTNRNTCLSSHDSYLKFTATVTNGATLQSWTRLSKSGANGFIQRLRLFHGSTLLEDVDNYNNLLAMLNTHQRSGDDVSYKGSITEGFEESCAVTVGPYNINGLRGARLSNPTYLAGDTAPNGALVGGAVTAPKTFCLSLVSILGTLTDKYLPLFACSGSPLRLELQMVSSAQMVVVSPAAVSTFTITNAEFVGSFIELSDQALSVIQQSQMGGPLTMAVNRYANLVYMATLNTVPTNVASPVPFQYSSLQAILCSIRQYATGAPTYDAFGSHNHNINEWYFQMGSESIPSKHVGSSTSGGADHTSMFMSYCSALGSPADINYTPLVSLYTFDTLVYPPSSTELPNAVTNNLTSISGSFGIAMEFSSFPSADQDRIFSGRNTTTETIYNNILFNAQDVARTVRLDYYALHNSVLIFDNGMASIRF